MPGLVPRLQGGFLQPAGQFGQHGLQAYTSQQQQRKQTSTYTPPGPTVGGALASGAAYGMAGAGLGALMGGGGAAGTALGGSAIFGSAPAAGGVAGSGVGGAAAGAAWLTPGVGFLIGAGLGIIGHLLS